MGRGGGSAGLEIFPKKHSFFTASQIENIEWSTHTFTLVAMPQSFFISAFQIPMAED